MRTKLIGTCALATLVLLRVLAACGRADSNSPSLPSANAGASRLSRKFVASLTAAFGVRAAPIDIGRASRRMAELAELRAGARAQLRGVLQTPPTTLRHGGIEVHLLARTVRNHGELVRLTNPELDLLVYLRRKLDREGQPAPIKTVRARGYRFGHPSPAVG